jgi:UDP-GlcNAc3NAcA epimerase
MQKIVTVLGARPQFIKAAALSRAIQRRGNLREIIVHTGQHYDENMSDIFFQQMQIPKPDYQLKVTSSLHGEMTGNMMGGIEAILLKEKPDAVVVYGDTNSTLAGALAAKKIHLKLAHVEAGLRSFNMRMPEEINRILTDRISDFLFCPSDHAIRNLDAEGFRNFQCGIYQVGDIMKDVAFFYRDLARKPEFELPKQFVLATLHRAENTDDPARLRNMIDIFNSIASDTPVVLPLHPRTKSRLKDLTLPVHENLMITEPVGYLEMVYMLTHCGLVITDSGGLQKEAFFFSKYCITIREETEWTELVDNGYNILAGGDKSKILKAKNEYFQKALQPDPALYGTGNTADQILDVLLKA